MLKNKYVTLALTLVALVVFGGGVAAFANFSKIGSSFPDIFGYGYGYGYSSGFGYGYGYGQGGIYDSVYGPMYGFFGTDGSPTVGAVSDTTTSFTVNFSTSYTTANVTLYYSTPTQYLLSQSTGHVSENAQKTGARSITMSGVYCSQLYYFVLQATDLHGNQWNSSVNTTTTNSCGGGGGNGGGGGGGITFLLPPVTTVIPAGSGTGGSGGVSPSGSNTNPSSGSNINANNNAYQFPRNLRQGINGEDVLNLQKFLNAHNDTVALTGFGSAGDETIHFGPATTKAVAQFQIDHAQDLGLPAGGLTNGGAGRFGPLTRAFVNTMLLNGQ